MTTTFYFNRSDRDFDLNVAALLELCQKDSSVRLTLIGPSKTGRSGYRVFTDTWLEQVDGADGSRIVCVDIFNHVCITIDGIDTIVYSP